MARYILKRLLMLLVVVIGVVFIVFSILHLSPIDPIRTILGDSAPEAQVQAMREQMGLNDPFFVQFFNYIKNVLHGDFGVSYVNMQPVKDDLARRLPITMTMAIFSTVLSVFVGVPLGVFAALRQNTIYDNISSIFCLIFVAMPEFWFALMLIIVFAVKFALLPASGWYGISYAILPVIALGMGNTASILRTTRSSMLEVIRQDYIRTAKAKGQKPGTIITKHALRNALIPVITVVGLQFGFSLGGSFVIETVFAIPGLGKYLVDGASVRNIPVVQGGVILIAVSLSIVNLLIDIIYSIVDPRLTFAKKKSSKRKGGAQA